MRQELRSAFRSAHVSVFPGWEERTARAGIVGWVWRISAIRPPLPVIPWTAAMLNTQSFAPISLFLCPINWTIYTPLRCCARALLVFAAFGWPASSMAIVLGCSGSELRPIWQSRSYAPGIARCMFPPEEQLIANWRLLLGRLGWGVRLTNRLRSSTAR